MKARSRFVPVWLGAALFLACLSGCFDWQKDSDLEPIPAIAPLEAKVRMEFQENQENRDSLIGVFAGIEVSHAVPGRAYHVSAHIEFVGMARDKEFEEVHSAQDTVIELSWTFTEEIRNLKGVTLRGRFTVDSVELGRDSVTYY